MLSIKHLFGNMATENIMFSSRMMKWVGCVMHMREMRNAYKILVGKPVGSGHLEDLGIDGSIISKWIIRK
jgi:hypothetical protein